MHAPRSYQLRAPLHLLQRVVSTKLSTVCRRLTSTVPSGQRLSISPSLLSCLGGNRLADCWTRAYVIKKPSAKERLQRDQHLQCAPQKCFDQVHVFCSCLWCFSRATPRSNAMCKQSSTKFCVVLLRLFFHTSNIVCKGSSHSDPHPPSSTIKTFIVPKRLSDEAVPHVFSCFCC